MELNHQPRKRPEWYKAVFLRDLVNITTELNSIYASRGRKASDSGRVQLLVEPTITAWETKDSIHVQSKCETATSRSWLFRDTTPHHLSVLVLRGVNLITPIRYLFAWRSQMNSLVSNSTSRLLTSLNCRVCERFKLTCLISVSQSRSEITRKAETPGSAIILLCINSASCRF